MVNSNLGAELSHTAYDLNTEYTATKAGYLIGILASAPSCTMNITINGTTKALCSISSAYTGGYGCIAVNKGDVFKFSLSGSTNYSARLGIF